MKAWDYYHLSLIIAVFVTAYSFMGWMTFFLHCKPMAAHWDKSIKPSKCYSIKLFVNFSLINTCKPFNPVLGVTNLAKSSSFQYLYRCIIRHLPGTDYLDPSNEVENSTISDWHSKFGIRVSGRSLEGVLVLMPVSRAVVMGILKANYQINFATAPDKTL